MTDTNLYDLRGRICPYPVVEVIRVVDNMKQEETRSFWVDDPLAVKSIPEELKEYDNLSFCSEKKGDFWEITVSSARRTE